MKRLSAVLIALTIAAHAHALSGARQQAASPKPANPPHPVVNVNEATEAQLQLLPGVGAKLANAIYTYAEAGEGAAISDPKCDHRCHFKTVEDLLKVKGIKAGKLAKLRPYVVVSGATTATAKISMAKAAVTAPPNPNTVGKARCAQLGARCAG